MNKRVIAGLALVSLLGAADASAQSRRDRRDRSDGAYDRGSDRGSDRRVERDAPGTQPAGTQAAGSPARPGEMDPKFRVLLERSIFARSGTAAAIARPPTTSTAPSAPQLSPEQAVVFVGVIAQDNEYIAFAENQTTRQLMILRNGDDVARGKVVAITLDTIAYGSGGTIKEVQLGQNLAGEVVSTSFTASGSSAGGPTTGSTAAPSTAGMTPEAAAVLERMRQRRQRGE
jgi:hypothetical protein